MKAGKYQCGTCLEFFDGDGQECPYCHSGFVVEGCVDESE